jgi:hypothetical protein
MNFRERAIHEAKWEGLSLCKQSAKFTPAAEKGIISAEGRLLDNEGEAVEGSGKKSNLRDDAVVAPKTSEDLWHR